MDWGITALLFLLGAGVIAVLAQMHRNPLLSRITDTKPNELGGDFYLRLFSFGTLPVFTWLASQFPDVGTLLFRFFQPGTDVLK
jgi:hypothetical protein